MDISTPKTESFLDRVLRVKGKDELKGFFSRLLQQNSEKAVELINDNNLNFTSLFIINPDFRDEKFSSLLNTRNHSALEIMNLILSRDTKNMRRLSSENRQNTYSTLNWILRSGYRDDGINSDYEEILETSAVLLVKEHEDRSVLPLILEMIYSRYNKGLLIYDLVWAFFEACNPESLIPVAERLNSSDIKEIELSRKLLGFIPCMQTNPEENPQVQSTRCIAWLKENMPFLHYTGESFLQTPNPIPYVVSLEAKYLCKAISPSGGKPLKALTMAENSALSNFRILDYPSKVLLSNYSYWLYRQNIYFWNIWRSYPVLEQLNSARNAMGGLL